MSARVQRLVDTPLAAALRYAAIGWHVLPVLPGSKRPAASNWQDHASADPKQIQAWWQAHPRAGIAVHCGKSGLAVIDVDPRNGGNETLARLQRALGYLWDEGAPQAFTGGGGQHFVFAAPQGVHLPQKLGQGLDLLQGDRYFIVAPSLHPSGRAYRWEPGCSPFEIADIPVLPAAWRAAENATPARGLDPADALLLPSTRPLEDTPEERERVESALACLSADCDYPLWQRIAFAVLASGLSDAEGIARDWSRSAPARFSEKAFRTLVSSYRDARRRGGDLVSVGTLFHLAKEQGWTDPRTPKASEQDHFGDLDNGRRFAVRYRGQFLYVHGESTWLRWDGSRWVRCESGEERGAAQSVATEGLDAALAALRKDSTDRTRDNYRQAMSVHRNLKRHDALLTIASTAPGMGIGNRGQLDSDPMKLGVRNGVVDLRSGTLLAPSPDMLITRQAGAAFIRDAQCPRWMQFLTDVFEGDAEMVAFVQRSLGYALTGLVEEEVLFFLYGTGANGKSVFSNIVHAVFGDYAVNVRSALLTRDPRGSNAEGEREKNRLPGARLALINEVGSADLFDDARLKELVARDPIGARALYGESFEFIPTHHLWLRGNHQPGAMDASDGFWRRILLVPFRRQFIGAERVPDLERRILDAERDGILAWMVDGCLAWQRQGLRVPQSIQREVNSYRADTDLMGQWLEDCCQRDPRAEESTSVLFNSYVSHLGQAGVRAPTKAVFGRQMAARGFVAQKKNGVRGLRGLRLREWDGADDVL